MPIAAPDRDSGGLSTYIQSVLTDGCLRKDFKKSQNLNPVLSIYIQNNNLKVWEFLCFCALFLFLNRVLEIIVKFTSQKGRGTEHHLFCHFKRNRNEHKQSFSFTIHQEKDNGFNKHVKMIFISDKQEAFCHYLILFFSPTQTYLILCQILNDICKKEFLFIASADHCNKEQCYQSWGDGFMINSTGCSSTRSKFCSQHPCFLDHNFRKHHLQEIYHPILAYLDTCMHVAYTHSHKNDNHFKTSITLI